jgi:hypothetical protein
MSDTDRLPVAGQRGWPPEDGQASLRMPELQFAGLQAGALKQ